jgi:Asp-tRNA(Asn)/Glu-tRNA(Gln) amidotransferase A subunit family amidase
LLADKRLAVKDLFQLAGHRNAAGNPDWYASHSEAEHTADSLAKCLQEGAVFNGFTVTDEIAYSLEGANHFFGSADNPKVPGHLCGGSSMGSAAAVAADLADIALGTDTGGSVRVPASYCGIFGIRPSHGIIDTAGLIGLAAPFDTIGWFAQNSADLAAVGEVLLPQQAPIAARQLVICPDILALADAAVAGAISDKAQAIAERLELPLVTRRLDHAQIDSLNELNGIFRVLQGRACIDMHGDWLKRCKPKFAPAIAERFKQALALSDSEWVAAQNQRKRWHQYFDQWLGNDDILLMPSSVTTAPKANQSQTALRQRLLNLTAIAGLTGSVQVHVPHFTLQQEGLEKPAGFSLLRHAGHDRVLLNRIKECF